jgi:hypothetical protein
MLSCPLNYYLSIYFFHAHIAVIWFFLDFFLSDCIEESLKHEKLDKHVLDSFFLSPINSCEYWMFHYISSSIKVQNSEVNNV